MHVCIQAPRRRSFALVLLLACPIATTAHAQEPPPDATIVHWSARVMPGYQLTRSHPSDDQGGDDSNAYGVFLDQARLELELERGMLEAELSVELADGLRTRNPSKPSYVRDAYLGARFTKALRLRAGHFKRPFSRMELTSSGALPMRGRGLTNAAIVEDANFGGRALGLMLWGKLPGKLSYHAGLSNPDFFSDSDVATNGAAANGRVEWELVPELSLGVDYAYNLRVDDDGEDAHRHAAGFDAALQAGPLEVVFDARIAEAAPSAISDSPLAYGLAAYGRYDIPVGRGVALQPVLFGEYLDADTDFLRDEGVRGVVGLNVIIVDGLRVMPQAEVVRSLREASNSSPVENSERYYVMLSAQL